MENKVTETQKSESQIIKKQPVIKASTAMWAKFDEWMAVQGCQTLPEGLRAAIRQVTGFSRESQQKIA
jgi:hypothetical protein